MLTCRLLAILLGVFLLGGILSSCRRKNATKLVVDVENAEANKTQDFGGVITQSFQCTHGGRIAAVRILIEGRENPRDLLVLLRAADENGYAHGEVLASGLVTIRPVEPPKATWQEVKVPGEAELSAGRSYCLELHPSTPHGGYGYFEYAYSMKNRHAGGRLHTDDHGRRIPPDVGRDLCFAVVTEVPESTPGRAPSPLEDHAPIRPPDPPVAKPVGQKKKTAVAPELGRLLNFLRWYHLALDDHEGVRVQMWASGGKMGRGLPLVDEEITTAQFDIYYGLGTSGNPLVHVIDGDGGGHTAYVAEMKETHFNRNPSLEEARNEKSLLIGTGYAHGARIWLKLSGP